MTLYSIYESAAPLKPADLEPAAVPERFSWLAALLPPVYALVHGLVLFPLAWVLILVVIGAIGGFAGPAAAFWSYLLLALLLGLEASAFRRGRLMRKGRVWRGDVIATADDLALNAWLIGPGRRRA